MRLDRPRKVKVMTEEKIKENVATVESSESKKVDDLIESVINLAPDKDLVTRLGRCYWRYERQLYRNETGP